MRDGVSLTVVDGWLPAWLCHIFTLMFFSEWRCIIYSFSCLPHPSLTYSEFLCLQSFPYLCFPVLVSLSASLHFSYFSPFAFLPLVCAVDCLPEQHVAGGERKKQPWRRKKAHWQKLLPPSLLVAAKKYINYLNDWMMLAQLWGCCLCRDEWRSSAQCRFLCWLVFVLRVQPRHQ